MYLCMAVSTSGVVFPLIGFTRRGMRDMALHTQERHCHLQHIIVHRAMRAMAADAVLGIFSMLIEERAFLVSMALRADFLHCCLPEQVFIGSPVRLMTVYAEELLFVYGVVARQGEFRLDFLMAALAHIFHLRSPYRKIRSHVHIMAIEAGHITDSMGPCIPVVEVKICRCSMAFQAYKRLSRLGEFFKINKCFEITGCLFPLLRILCNLFRSKALNSKASRAVT